MPRARAAVWICERLSPQQFAPRQPRQYTTEQVMQFYARITDTLMADVPEVVDEPPVPETAVVEPPEASQEIGPTRPGSELEDATPGEPGPARPNGSTSPSSSAPPPQPSDRPSPSSG